MFPHVREQNFKAFWVETLETTPSTLRATTLHISRLVAFCLLMPHVLPQTGKWGSRARQHISPGIRKSSSLNSSPKLLSDVLYAFGNSYVLITFKNEIAYFFPLCVRKRKTFVAIFRQYVLNVPIAIALYKVVVHIQDTISCAPSCLFCFSLLYSVSVYFKMLNFPSYFPH